MDYVLIKGSFHVVGFSPDGDSVAFQAADDRQWDRLVASDGGKAKVTRAPRGAAALALPPGTPPGTQPSMNVSRFRATLLRTKGNAQLRLVGIDAPETHFSPTEGARADFISRHPVAEYRQPGDFADLARAALLAALGVTDLKWGSVFSAQFLQAATVTASGDPGTAVRVTTKFTDTIPGYIVTREVESNGRPVAWVFLGDPGLPDGSTLTPEALAERVPRSVNHQLLAAGLVYPFFYVTMENVLRQQLAQAVDIAVGAAKRSRRRVNLWSVDRSAKGVAIPDVAAILPGDGTRPDGALVWPYLFRKVLKTWYQSTGATTTAIDLNTFWVNGNPTVAVAGDHVRLDSLLTLSGGTLRLTTPPQNIVFPA